MAQVTGLVQQMKYNPILDVAFVWLGPTSANSTLYYVLRREQEDEAEASIKNSMIDALTAAMFQGRPVVATVDGQEITVVQINPV